METKRINYLNNKDLLIEIHKSKNSYGEYTEDDSVEYDIIVDLPKPSVKGGKVKIHPPASEEYIKSSEVRRMKCMSKACIETAINNRAARLSAAAFKKAVDVAEVGEKPSKNDYIISPDDIDLRDIVIRFHTYEHIPLNSERKDKKTTEADYRERVNFIPFIHYKLNLKDGIITGLREVGRSHTKNGQFSTTHGSITDKLAIMFILLTDKYAQKHNWRGYTYVDDMKGSALLQFANVGLQFNEARSENPFAYLTTVLKNAFLRVFLSEKKQQDIRDDLIEIAGDAPSNGRQTDRDEEMRIGRDKLQQTHGDFDT